MKVLLIINCLSALLVSVLIAGNFFKKYRKGILDSVSVWFSVIFFSYALLFVIYFSWMFNFLSYDLKSYVLIYSVAIFVQTLFLFRAINTFLTNKKVKNFLFFYFALILFAAVFSFELTVLTSLLISFLLTLILFLNFISASPAYKRAGYFGIIYASVSSLTIFMFLFNLGDFLLFSLISNVFFLIFVFLFFKDSEVYPSVAAKKKVAEKDSYFLLFVKYFVYVIVITNFVLISTIGLHEVGHVLVARYYGCESRTIIFEENSYPYSEIICDDLAGKIPITLAGPVIPLIVAIVLFFIEGKSFWSISFLIFGFNLLASGRDFSEIGVSESLILASAASGVIFLAIGLIFLAKSKVQEYASQDASPKI